MHGLESSTFGVTVFPTPLSLIAHLYPLQERPRSSRAHGHEEVAGNVGIPTERIQERKSVIVSYPSLFVCLHVYPALGCLQLNQTINATRSNWLQQPVPASPSSSGEEPEELHLPPLACPKQQCSNPFPRTTAREVGWRSARKDCALELYGHWARGKGSILKQLKWPHDAVP